MAKEKPKAANKVAPTRKAAAPAPKAQAKLKKTVAKVTAEVMDDEIPQTTTRIPVLDVIPFVSKDKAFEVKGNYDVVKNALTARRDEIVKKKFSAKDLDTVLAYKREARGYRTALESLEKDVKKRYFNGPKDIFAGQIASLQAIVADIEGKTDIILNAEEAKRTAELTSVFDIYKADFQDEYNLSEEGLGKIEYKQAYYNKTAKEAESKADIEQQFKDLHAAEEAQRKSEKLIRQTCEGNKLLDVEFYVRQLDTLDLASILGDIETEKNRLAAVKSGTPVGLGFDADKVQPVGAEQPDSSSAPAQDAVVIGVKGIAGSFFSSGSDFPGKTKKRTIEIEYPIDFGDGITEVFKYLAQFGIKVRDKKEVY
jgi:hypothetical protein